MWADGPMIQPQATTSNIPAIKDPVDFERYEGSVVE